MSKFSEDLFQSIDTIIQQRIENLPYDKTIVCKIKSLDSKKIGKYIVLYQDTELIAYSESMDYKPDEEVYVSVQQGDFSKKKMITGRVIEELPEKINIRPFESFIPIQEIITQKNEYAMSVNNPGDKNHNIIVWNVSDTENMITGYNLLGLKFSISALLENINYTVISGTYSVKIIIDYIDQITGEKKSDSSIVNIEDMIFINPYNTSGFCNQEFVYDITNKSVNGITVVLQQDNNFQAIYKGEEQVLLPWQQNLQIQIKDTSLKAGYSLHDFDEASDRIYLYSVDNLFYNETNFTKKLRFRYLSKKDDIITLVNNYVGVFGKYVPDTIHDNGGIFGKDDQSYERIPSINNEAVVELNPSRSVDGGYFLVSILRNGNYIISNKIFIRNNEYVKDVDLFDLVSGLSLTSDTSTEGVFNYYGQDKQLLDSAAKNKLYYLMLTFNGFEEELQPGRDTIYVYIPKDKSMIDPPDHDYEIIEENNSSQNNRISYYMRAGQISPNPGEKEFKYREEDKSVLIPFKIKELYNQSYTNNTIICKCEINGKTYTIEKELFFGFSGATGADYILKLKLFQKTQENKYIESNCISVNNSNIKEYKVKAFLYDYTMQEQNATDVSFELGETNRETLTRILSWDHTTGELSNKNLVSITSINNDINNSVYGELFIKGTLEINNKILYAYLPLPLSLNDDNYNYISGCQTIVYDITGKKPYYYTDPFKLYSRNNNQILNTEWFVNNNDNIQLTDNYCIIPSNIYNSSKRINFAYCKILNSIVWIQPICVIQNRYPSAMWNGEGNQLQLNENEILTSNVVGKFSGTSGVFMGMINTNGNENFGLFKYNNGTKVFELSDTKFYLYEPIFSENSIIPKANSLNINTAIGNDTKPVYFSSNGLPMTCGNSLAVSITGNAATASDCQTNGTLDNRIKQLEQKIAALEQQLSNNNF